ncbi:MAG: ArsI/CadI family heavy metal resistance metalloenzyme [Acidobacteriota bacterium]
MQRLHVMLKVADLETSKQFYSTLFAAQPTVEKTDYAKWMLDDPRVNFSIAQTASDHGVEHLGIQAESRDELAALRERIARIDGTVRDEGETVCCYAESDKTWVTDAQGVSWETFYTHGASEVYGKRDTDCCDSSCCEDEAEVA